LSLKH